MDQYVCGGLSLTPEEAQAGDVHMVMVYKLEKNSMGALIKQDAQIKQRGTWGSGGE